MWKEGLLSLIWSIGGPTEKLLLKHHSPDAYAATKAIAVSVGYLITRQPLDFKIFYSPFAWILLCISLCNTPLYARIVAQGDPSISIPLIATTANVLRLLWVRLDPNSTPLTVKQWIGISLVICGGLCLR